MFLANRIHGLEIVSITKSVEENEREGFRFLRVEIQILLTPKWHIFLTAGTTHTYIFFLKAKLNSFQKVTVFKIANW